MVGKIRRLGTDVAGVDLGLDLVQSVAAALVEARLAHQTGAGQSLRVSYHVGVDAVTEWTTVLTRVIRYVLVLFLVYVSHILQAEGVAVGRPLLGFEVGNALYCQHHVGEELVQLAMLIFGGERGGLGGRWGTRGGVGVGVLLVTCRCIRHWIRVCITLSCGFN